MSVACIRAFVIRCGTDGVARGSFGGLKPIICQYLAIGKIIFANSLLSFKRLNTLEIIKVYYNDF